MRRDLKLDNFLLATKEENAMLKATDFGLSVFNEEGNMNEYIRSVYTWNVHCFAISLYIFEH